jgi:hypothetical protein
MGTRWEQTKKTKKSHPTPSPKRKKSTPCERMLTFLIGCMKLVFGKLSAEKLHGVSGETCSGNRPGRAVLWDITGEP